MLLFLNDVAGSEVVLILLFILIFFGPKSIPGIAKSFGKTIYQIKQASDDLKSEISKSGNSIKKDLNLDGIFKGGEDSLENEIIAPLKREINEVDSALNSISYDKKIPVGDTKKEDITENLAENTTPKETVSTPVIEKEDENHISNS